MRARSREFGGSVSVIDGPQIVNSQQPFLRDLLQTTPGLDIAQNGGPGRVASVFLRGQSSRATKVLVDGIPINDPSSPQRTFDFGSFNTLEIERIEVLRGPQSTLYGSDAVGGVINIITKRGQGPPRAWISTSGGSYGTFENVGHVSGGNSQGYYSAGASWFDTDGFSVANQRYGRPFNTENDAYRQTHRLDALRLDARRELRRRRRPALPPRRREPGQLQPAALQPGQRRPARQQPQRAVLRPGRHAPGPAGR